MESVTKSCMGNYVWKDGYTVLLPDVGKLIIKIEAENTELKSLRDTLFDEKRKITAKRDTLRKKLYKAVDSIEWARDWLLPGGRSVLPADICACLEELKRILKTLKGGE